MSILYKNAKIVTLDENDKLKPIQSWLLVKDGKIQDIGCNENVDESDIIKKVDLKSKWVLPGLHDCHLHVGHLGEQLNTLSLKGCKGKPEFISRIENYIKEKIKTHSDKSELLLIKALDWEQDILGFMPDRFILDKICEKFSDYKILMKMPRVCHHVHLYNSLVLELNNIDKSYAEKFNSDPSLGGEVDLDENGNLTGIFRENANSVAFESFFMKMRLDDQVRKEVMDGLTFCVKKGITCVHTCEVGYWNVWQEIYKTEKNKIPRCQITHFTNYFFDNKEKINYLSPNPKDDSFDKSQPLMSCIRVKIFTDGALGPQTAALSEPYKNCKCHDMNSAKAKGIAMENKLSLVEKITKIYKHGLGVELHVIGDAAADFTVEALLACEDLRKSNSKIPRPVLIHCQLLKKNTIQKIAKAGICASVQPQFVPTDCRWLDGMLTDSFLDSTELYPWKTLLDAGVLIGGGSDSPVETAEPLVGMHDAIFRPSGRDEVNETFRPKECLNFEEALRLYTTNGARMVEYEEGCGRLESGAPADFIVLDTEVDFDIFENLRSLKDLGVWASFIDGECVYSKNDTL